MASKRAALAVSAWFRLPSHMDTHEVLSRGSGFFVKNDAQPLLVASGHVVAPWRFPHYFGEEWISHVGPEQCRYFVEARDGSGGIAHAAEARVVAHHRTLDTAALALVDATEADALRAAALDLVPDAVHAAGDGVEIVGHVVEEDIFSDDLDDDEDARLMVPRSVESVFVRRLQTQHFAKNAGEPITMGMCGGPVLRKDGSCVGVVEGVVPTSDHPLSDHASFISALDLLPLVDDARRALAEAALDDEAAAASQRDPPPAALLRHLAAEPP